MPPASTDFYDDELGPAAHHTQKYWKQQAKEAKRSHDRLDSDWRQVQKDWDRWNKPIMKLSSRSSRKAELLSLFIRVSDKKIITVEDAILIKDLLGAAFKKRFGGGAEEWQRPRRDRKLLAPRDGEQHDRRLIGEIDQVKQRFVDSAGKQFDVTPEIADVMMRMASLYPEAQKSYVRELSEIGAAYSQAKEKQQASAGYIEALDARVRATATKPKKSAVRSRVQAARLRREPPPGPRMTIEEPQEPTERRSKRRTRSLSPVATGKKKRSRGTGAPAQKRAKTTKDRRPGLSDRGGPFKRARTRGRSASVDG